MENESPILYYIDKEYLKYLHKEDYRVSVKFNNRSKNSLTSIAASG